MERELKCRGRLSTTQKILDLQFKLGYRHVFSPDIEDNIYFGFIRDYSDLASPMWSLRNARVEFQVDKGLGDNNFWRWTFLVGKNFPMKKAKAAFSLSVDIVAQINNPYNGTLASLDEPSHISFLMRPGLKF